MIFSDLMLGIGKDHMKMIVRILIGYEVLPTDLVYDVAIDNVPSILDLVYKINYTCFLNNS